MKIVYFLGLITFMGLNFSCNSNSHQKEKAFLKNDGQIAYELINQVINDNIDSDRKYFLLYNQMKYIPLALYEETDDYLELSKYDSILSNEDIKYIYRQIDDLIHLKDFDLQQDKINNQNITVFPIFQYNQFRDKIVAGNKNLEYWEELENDFHIHEYYSISYPVFSIDGRTAIVSFGHHCGSLCGSGSIEIYQKKNGKWVPVEYLINWVS